jgi:hypothetical protein
MLALCASDAVDDCVVFMVLLADIQKIEPDLKNKPPTIERMSVVKGLFKQTRKSSLGIDLVPHTLADLIG